MSDQVEVPFGDNASETATLLLAAAEKLHDDQGLVRTSEGKFLVPKDVADEAGVDYESDDDDQDDQDDDDESKPARKTTAKKTAAKKS